MLNKLKLHLLHKLNNQHNIPHHIPKYINNYTGELSDYPILENLYILLIKPSKDFSKLHYMFSWRKY